MNKNMEEQIRKDFKEKFELTQKHNKTFREHIIQLFSEKGINKENIEEKTGLSLSMYRKLIKTDFMPDMKTVISICVGLELDMAMVETLLDSLAVKFNRNNKKNYAYQYIVTNYTGEDINSCNEILKILGLKGRELLGSTENM